MPWGRLLPSSTSATAGGKSIDLFPRPPFAAAASASSTSSTGNAAAAAAAMKNHRGSSSSSNCSSSSTSRRTGGAMMTWMGLGEHILLHPSDIFNEYVLGRSPKCDITAINPATATTTTTIAQPKQQQQSSNDDKNDKKNSNSKTQQQLELARQQWAFGMISNRHCKIYCCLENTNTTTTTTTPMHGGGGTLQVYCEDCSGNGTLINQEILLRRGEKRLLHTGDEICLVNPQTLQKKVRSSRGLQSLLQQHSFVFVLAATAASSKPHRATAGVPRLLASAAAAAAAANVHTTPNTQTSATANRKAAVDVRATRMPQPYKKNAPVQNNSPPVLPLSSSAAAAAAAGLSPSAVAATSSRYRHFQSSEQQQQQCQDPQKHHLRRRRRRRVEEDYDIRELLGSGTVGEVRRAIHRQTGQERAIKVITLQRNRHHFLTSAATAGAAANHPLTTTLEAEATILRGLSHPYIVQLIDVYVSDTAISLVMELLHGGDLFDRIVAKGRYTEIESRHVMRRLLSAIHYLHVDCNIVHRDLKPENILLENHHNHIQVKLTDFGLAKSLNGVSGLKTFCGTPQYFAPEVLKRRTTVTGRGRYGQQADMWSLGVIVYVLLSGTPPFDIDNDNGENSHLQQQQQHSQSAMYQVQFDPNDWEGVSDSARDFCKQLLVTDPQSRLTVQQACEHEWILTPDGDTHCHPLRDPQVLLHAAAADKGTKESEANGSSSNDKNEAVTVDAPSGSKQKTNSNDDKPIGDCKQDAIDGTTKVSTSDQRGKDSIEGAKNKNNDGLFDSKGNHSNSNILSEPFTKADNDMPSEKEEVVVEEENKDVCENDTCDRSASSEDAPAVTDTKALEKTTNKLSSSKDEQSGNQTATTLCFDGSLIDGSNRTPSQPCTMSPRSESLPEREDRAPLSPVQLNHEFASTQKPSLTDNGDIDKKLQMPLTREEEGNKQGDISKTNPTTLNSKLMLKAPASWKRPAVGRVSEVDEKGQKKAAAKLELSDDSVGNFSDGTESISSFTSIAENCEVKPDDSTAALPRKRRVTDTMGDSLARLEPPPATKKKAKKSSAAKQSHPTAKKSAKSKDAHSKQAKLSKWFQTSST